MEHINRRGEKYYVLQGMTKTGKPKFYCSKKAKGIRAEQLPAGYEVHEDPSRATVTVRKIRPSQIVAAERDVVVRLASKLAATQTIVDVDGSSIVVYATDVSKRDVDAWCEDLRPFGKSRAEIEAILVENSNFSPLFRFTLIEEDERSFVVERWCFRGSVDDWIELSGHGALEDVAASHLPHLGRESFYDLM